jgi:glycosyltransferase involved in cell wall biosynthesis
MKLCYYTPFKPLDHPHPSGDLITANGIRQFFQERGHRVLPASSLRCRWIYWKPWQWPGVCRERRREVNRHSSAAPDLWFTYHSYYKAPDMLGPAVARRLNIPYVLFQGIYSTKRRRKLVTKPGFYLNRHVLNAARHVFTNKKVDLHNLKRLLPDDRITYIAPGLKPDDFVFDASARAALRRRWEVGDDPVLLSVAMFRPDVKSEGIAWVIRTCGKLRRGGYRFKLVLVGAGKQREALERLAAEQVPDCVYFAGKVPRQELSQYYSAADLFVFPGINESLGMVYLEAQSCGLPVVAFDNAGVPEAVQDGKTGLLVPMYAGDQYAAAIGKLMDDKALRVKMGAAAGNYIREYHDLNRNYQKMEYTLQTLIQKED